MEVIAKNDYNLELKQMAVASCNLITDSLMQTSFSEICEPSIDSEKT